ILYELLAGSRPFSQGTRDTLASAIATQAPPPLRSLRPSICPGLDAIVRRCLEKAPEDRYPSAGQLADALRGWLDGTPPPEVRRMHRRAALGAVCGSAFGLAGLTAALG